MSAALEQFAAKALAEFAVNRLRLQWCGGDHFTTWQDYQRNYGWMASESHYLDERRAKLGWSIIYTGD